MLWAFFVKLFLCDQLLTRDFHVWREKIRRNVGDCATVLLLKAIWVNKVFQVFDLLQHVELLLGYLIQQYCNCAKSFSDHPCGVYSVLSIHSTSKVFASIRNDSFDRLDRNIGHPNVFQVDNHVPILYNSWNHQLLDAKSEKVVAHGDQIINADLSLNNFLHVHYYDWSALFVSLCNVQESKIQITPNTRSRIVNMHREGLLFPFIMLEDSDCTLLVDKLLSLQISQQHPRLIVVTRRDLFFVLLEMLSEPFQMLQFEVVPFLRWSVEDKSL